MSVLTGTLLLSSSASPEDAFAPKGTGLTLACMCPRDLNAPSRRRAPGWEEQEEGSGTEEEEELDSSHCLATITFILSFFRYT